MTRSTTTLSSPTLIAGLFWRSCSTSSLNTASMTLRSSPNAPPPWRVKPSTVCSGRPSFFATLSSSLSDGERLVGQLLRLLVEERLRLLVAVLGLELGAHLVEAALVRRLRRPRAG